MDPVELSDGRLVLRLPIDDDVDEITRACQDPELQRWIPVPVPYARRHGREWVADTLPSWTQDRELRWVITAAEDPAPLGAVGLHPHDQTMREIGYWLAPWARGRGVMTGAVRLACGWGFEDLGLQRIEWWANVGNEPSRRVAQRVGFTMEGTCRSRLMQRGERVDGWVGGLLPGELR